ncbi:amino acid adenylation domain-containing protein [Streptomyces griseoaurantiacus]|uniref:non-ribosomal peptide synthetase n=1 Tax=Streptomyces griseoaurantiacus TaxID=68213 RepID=UPI0034602562
MTTLPGLASSPLSYGQRRLWLLTQREGAHAAYNEPMPFRLRGPLDRTVLRRALDAVTARHEVLRTRIVPSRGEPQQRVDPPDSGFRLAVDDLTGLPDAEARVTELVRRESFAPFDMADAPLARGRLLILGPEHHVLVLTVHHAMFDGWSRSMMLRETGALYTALLRGEPDPLPPVPLQYTDFTRGQRTWMAGPGPLAQETYWTDLLEGAPPLLELPTDRPRPPTQDHTGARARLEIGPELTVALKAVTERHEGSLFSTLLTGWAIVLSRLSGQRDLVVGTPTANRRGEHLDGLMGFVVNTLALRIRLADAPTGSALLRQVRATVRAGVRNAELPFERVVELVNPPRSTAHTPLFQTMLAWVPPTDGLMELPGVEVRTLPVPFAPAKFDQVLALREEDGGIVGELDYATALFDRTTVERHLRYLVRVLEQLARAPERAVDEYALMDEAETAALLADWDATGFRAPGERPGADGDGAGAPDARAAAGEERAAPPSRPAGLLARFEEWVRTAPEATAVVAGDRSLTYAALDRRANRLAHALIARGVGEDQVVALHAGRTAELVVGVLGILKAGAAWLPLDPGQPVRRLAAMVADARPALVLTDQRDPDADAGLDGDAAPDGDAERGRDADAGPHAFPAAARPLTAVEAEGGSEDAPGVTVPDSALAYVIYTSGSTGRPKGVAVTHGNVLNLFDQWLDRFGATPGEATSAWSSIGFDASVHELLLPLTTGAALHLVPEEVRGDPAALMDWLREHRVVQAFLPPAYVRWIDEAPHERLAGLALRQVLTGVESLPEGALHRMTTALPGLRICFGYGPTETTLYSTAHLDPRPVDGPCPIGRPLPGTRLYLLDERMRPVPPGVVGEVYIGGASVARGYLGHPELTAERFLDDPFVPGGRVYRTGDLARRLPDGNAEYAGRRDDQIKLRGFRIEPGEVEAALLALPGVREAAVLADRDPAGELRLVAGLGRGGEPARQPHEWRAALAAHLPDHMIPSAFVELPALPLGRGGKLDRAALLEKARAALTSRVNTGTPRDHVEMTLHRIWSRLLLHPRIGITDDFFDVGGTSVSAIKVAHAIGEEFGTPLPIQDVIRHRTIEALAERLRRGGPRPPGGNLLELRPGTGRRRLICVHPAGGTAFCYLPLADALPEDIGVFGIQAPGIEPGEEPLPGVEAMAEAYLDLVDARPEEFLVLCGLSYGGLIAHEMGRLLARAGHRRLSVVLLDTQATEDPAARAAIEPVTYEEFTEKLVRFNGMYPGIEADQLARYHATYNHSRATARAHEPRPTTVPLTLIEAAADGPGPGGPHPTRDFWRRRARAGLTVVPLDCGHWELLEGAQVTSVAEAILADMDRLHAAEPVRRSVPSGTRGLR